MEFNADNWYEPHEHIDWDIRHDGRAYSRADLEMRYDLAPDKIELIEGKVFGTDSDRIMMLGMLLENMGADCAVRLGNPDVWREAVERLTGK